MISLFPAFLFPLLIMVAGAGDVLSRRIPNWITLVIGLSFFPLAWTAGMPWTSVLTHACAGFGLLVAGFIVFSFGFIGGGDAKLIAAAGVWFGLTGLSQFLMMTVLAGGLLSLGVLAWSIVSFETKLRNPELSRHLGSIRPSVPYGFAIAAGALIAFPESWWSATLAT